MIGLIIQNSFGGTTGILPGLLLGARALCEVVGCGEWEINSVAVWNGTIEFLSTKTVTHFHVSLQLADWREVISQCMQALPGGFQASLCFKLPLTVMEVTGLLLTLRVFLTSCEA